MPQLQEIVDELDILIQQAAMLKMSERQRGGYMHGLTVAQNLVLKALAETPYIEVIEETCT